jgi:uncharacterized repeat protein (TIGR01451 family)
MPPSVIPALASAGLTIQNTVDNTTPLPGDTVNYTLVVSALGPATSSMTTATDLLPPGLTFLNASTSAGVYNNTTGVWTIGDLTAGSTVTLELSAAVNASDTTDEIIPNTASVTESSTETNPNQAQTSATALLTVEAPTVTPQPPAPPIQVPEILSIGQNGSFLGRGMTVTSVGSSSFQANVWGVTYTVDLVMPPQFFFRNGNQDSGYSSNEVLEQLSVGDVVGVSGNVATANPLVVNGQVVRNYTTISPRPWPVYNSPQPQTPTFGYGQNNTNSSNSNSFQGELSSLTTELQNLENMFNDKYGIR